MGYKPLMLVGKKIGKRLKLVYKGKTLVRLAMPSFIFFHLFFKNCYR